MMQHKRNVRELILVTVLLVEGAYCGLAKGTALMSVNAPSTKSAAKSSDVPSPSASQAPDNGPPAIKDPQLRIGVLDLDLVMHESKVGQDLQAQIEQKRNAFQKDVEALEAGLRDKQAKLKEKEASGQLSAEELLKHRQAFDQAVDEVQKKIRVESKILEDAFLKARTKISQEVMRLVTTIAEEKGITLVLPKTVVMYRHDAYEFTDDLIGRLNHSYPKAIVVFKKGV